MGKQWLVGIAFVLIGALIAVSYGPSLIPSSPSLIPSSVEEISPIEEEEQVDYIAKPPSQLGKDLFSYELDDQQRQNNWSKYVGKWVVWVGDVQKVTPKLKPSRVEFLPEEYESAGLFPEQIYVVVDFKPQWTEHLKRLSEGETVYYRAKLTKKGYGMTPGSYLLFLEQGEIVPSESVEARLVDLAYSSYEQLQDLLEDARQIAAIRDYFAEKLEHLTLKRLAIEAALGLLNIRLPEKTWLEQISLPEKEQRKRLLESEIQESLRSSLISLHSANPVQDELYLEEIAKKADSNREMVAKIKDARKLLETAWERERKSTTLGIDDLLEALIGQLHGSIGLTLTVEKAWEKYEKLDSYQQLVALSCIVLWQIDKYMEKISNNVIEVTDNITFI